MATRKDAKGIAHVKVMTWQATYKGILKDDYLKNMAVKPIRRSYSKWIGTDHATVMVLEDEGRVVGYASGGEARSEDHHGYGEIYALYVLPEYQGDGRGESLMYYMVQALRLRGYNDLVIWCLSKNPSQGFYKRLGGKSERAAQLTIGGEQYLERAYIWQDVAAALTPNQLETWIQTT